MEDKELDKLKKRFEILNELISVLSHGKAVVYWADKTVIKIERIETDTEIKK